MYYFSLAAADAKCTGKGDVHYYTFDGKRIDYQGDCTYQLVATTEGATDVVPVDIKVSARKRWADDHVSFVRDVLINVYGYNIKFTEAEGVLVCRRIIYN